MHTLFKRIMAFVVVLAIAAPAIAHAKKSRSSSGTSAGGEMATTFTKSDTLPGGINVVFSVVTLAKYKKSVDEVFDYTFRETKRIADLFYGPNPTSDVARVNENAGVAPVSVNKEVFVIGKLVKRIADWTHGAFNPVSNGSYMSLKTNEKDQTLYLSKAGSSLELTGVLNGFIADLFIRAAYHSNLDDAFVKVNGVYRSMGEDTYGPWWFMVTGNGEKTAKHGMRVTLTNYSAAIVGGEYPALTTSSEFHSVVVLAKEAAIAQGVANSVYILGKFGGESLINALGIRAIFVYPDGKLVKIGRW